MTDGCKHNVLDIVAERLRRWTANPLGSPRVGSNPIDVVLDITRKEPMPIQSFLMHPHLMHLFCLYLLSCGLQSGQKTLRAGHTAATGAGRSLYLCAAGARSGVDSDCCPVLWNLAAQKARLRPLIVDCLVKARRPAKPLVRWIL